MQQRLLNLCNMVMEGGDPPEDWKVGEIVPLPKKGNLADCNNWRGVTLLSVPGKAFCLMILNRIKESVDDLVREEQAGFRANRSCSDQIFTLRRILEKCLSMNSPVAASFIDFKKAFNCLHRQSLWSILHDFGIPSKFVNII